VRAFAHARLVREQRAEILIRRLPGEERRDQRDEADPRESSPPPERNRIYAQRNTNVMPAAGVATMRQDFLLTD
jgi:hypothetical protein